MSIHAIIDPLIWESDFFGRRLGRIIFNNAAPCLNSLLLKEFTLVQARVEMQAIEHINILSALNFRLVEGEIDCCYTLSSNFSVVSSIALLEKKVRMADISDIPALRALVLQTQIMSRFRPPWFSNEEGRSFYAQWVENAVRGSFDHLCLIVEGENGLEGLVTLRNIDEQVARIGLLVVSPVARGRGTGKLLCHAALNWCRNHAFSHLWVATQSSNIPALQLYLASGAQIRHTTYWLYRGAHDSI